MNTADQVRRMGLQIGDTIEGVAGGSAWWNVTRLTLLWVGDEVAVWRVTDRSSQRPDWSEPHEAGHWTLECRDWRKVKA